MTIQQDAAGHADISERFLQESGCSALLHRLLREDGRVLNSESIELLSRAVLCWLATADASGNPSVSPKEIFLVRSEAEILIADIASPRTTRNITQNTRACIAAIDVFEQRGLQVFGSAEVVRAGDPRWEELSPPLIELAGDAFPVRSVIRLSVERVKEIVAPSIWMYPDRDAVEVRSAVLDRYGVRDR